MYLIIRDKELENKQVKLLDIEGFPMESRKKAFQIKGSTVTKIKVVDKAMANSIVSKKVLKKYTRLISALTELLVDDDDSGDACVQVLNQIEKFRLEIKNKYRRYLKKKELEKMSKQLVLLQKEATKRLEEINNSFLEYNHSNKHSK